MKKNETGRSMVEMIGVLAIIGVLSIGSLAAYDYTKARARTASIVDVASKLLAIARVKGKTVSTFSEKMEYTIDSYQIAATARITRNTEEDKDVGPGKGIVTICGCNIGDEEKFKSRLEQISGVTVNNGSKPDELSRLTKCGDNTFPECFELIFPGEEETD